MKLKWNIPVVMIWLIGLSSVACHRSARDAFKGSENSAWVDDHRIAVRTFSPFAPSSAVKQDREMCVKRAMTDAEQVAIALRLMDRATGNYGQIHDKMVIFLKEVKRTIEITYREGPAEHTCWLFVVFTHKNMRQKAYAIIKNTP